MGNQTFLINFFSMGDKVFWWRISIYCASIQFFFRLKVYEDVPYIVMRFLYWPASFYTTRFCIHMNSFISTISVDVNGLCGSHCYRNWVTSP